jgi:ABC-2 type transport system ATP-binding protein
MTTLKQQNSTSKSSVVLRTVGLTKRFGSLEAVGGLTLDINEGEVFGFLGPNGAGKTTAIRMMCGLLRPDSGSVEIRGVPLTGRRTDVRARIGVCPQDIVLWERLTCREQLEFVGKLYGLPGKTAKRSAGLLLEALQLSEKTHVQAHALSGGMRRRLNLAAALVHDPEIVLLDEPEAGLDPQSRILVREFIRSLARKKTVILTTHNMDEADRLSDRVAIIDHGRLLVLENPETLKRHEGEDDVLEILLRSEPKDKHALVSAVNEKAAGARVSIQSGALVVRARNAVRIVPDVLDTLKRFSCPYEDVRLRPTTLEDVFIRLTGRSLRQ